MLLPALLIDLPGRVLWSYVLLSFALMLTSTTLNNYLSDQFWASFNIYKGNAVNRFRGRLVNVVANGQLVIVLIIPLS